MANIGEICQKSTPIKIGGLISRGQNKRSSFPLYWLVNRSLQWFTIIPCIIHYNPLICPKQPRFFMAHMAFPARPEKPPVWRTFWVGLAKPKVFSAAQVVTSQKVTTKGGQKLDPPKKNPTESLVWALTSDSIATSFKRQIQSASGRLFLKFRMPVQCREMQEKSSSLLGWGRPSLLLSEKDARETSLAFTLYFLDISMQGCSGRSELARLVGTSEYSMGVWDIWVWYGLPKTSAKAIPILVSKNLFMNLHGIHSYRANGQRLNACRICIYIYISIYHIIYHKESIRNQPFIECIHICHPFPWIRHGPMRWIGNKPAPKLPQASGLRGIIHRGWWGDDLRDLQDLSMELTSFFCCSMFYHWNVAQSWSRFLWNK